MTFEPLLSRDEREYAAVFGIFSSFSLARGWKGEGSRGWSRQGKGMAKKREGGGGRMRGCRAEPARGRGCQQGETYLSVAGSSCTGDEEEAPREDLWPASRSPS